MVCDPNDYVQIAGRASAKPGVTLTSNADALAIPRAGLDPNLERFATLNCTFPVALGTGRDISSRAMASWAGNIEFHPPPGLRDLAFAAALGTAACRFGESLTMAVRAGIAPGDVQAHHAPTNGRPEWHIDLILQI